MFGVQTSGLGFPSGRKLYKIAESRLLYRTARLLQV